MRDIDIRRALLAEMRRLHPDSSDTLILEELEVCQGLARVDLAVVNGSFHGYEIKSERDTLLRLPSQTEFYNQALQFVTLVAAPRHLSKIDSVIPPWWGVWQAEQIGSSVRLEETRESQPNPSLVKLALVQFLWRNETLQILDKYDLSSGVRSKSRHHLWAKLASSFEPEELGDLVRGCLKSRGENWRAPCSIR